MNKNIALNETRALEQLDLLRNILDHTAKQSIRLVRTFIIQARIQDPRLWECGA